MLFYAPFSSVVAIQGMVEADLRSGDTLANSTVFLLQYSTNSSFGRLVPETKLESLSARATTLMVENYPSLALVMELVLERPTPEIEGLV